MHTWGGTLGASICRATTGMQRRTPQDPSRRQAVCRLDREVFGERLVGEASPCSAVQHEHLDAAWFDARLCVGWGP